VGLRGVVLALGAAPDRVGEEVLGLDGQCHLMDEASRPAEILDRSGGRETFEPWFGRLEQDVQAQGRNRIEALAASETRLMPR
jgi:hypothetical protein